MWIFILLLVSSRLRNTNYVEMGGKLSGTVALDEDLPASPEGGGLNHGLYPETGLGKIFVETAPRRGR